MVHLIKAALGNINTRHGEQIGRGFPHVGIDIGWGGGLELYAPAAGWLSWSWAGTYGNLGRITHADGSYSRLAHADSYNGVNGRHVEQGEHIGTMGRSGGPWGTSGWFVHCHQEYWVDGVAVDPTDYMGSSPAGETITPIGGILMALSDEEQAELLSKTRAVWDALFKTTPISGTTTGGNSMPGGLLRMASINYDATFQKEGVNGATRDGVLPALADIRDAPGL